MVYTVIVIGIMLTIVHSQVPPTCYNGQDPCDLTYPCVVDVKVPSSTNCTDFYLCAASYEWALLYDNCLNPDVFGYTSCECEDPASATCFIESTHCANPQVPVPADPGIPSEPCNPPPTCTSGDLLPAIGTCTRYHRCEGGAWVSETCAQGTYYNAAYGSCSTDPFICVYNLCREVSFNSTTAEPTTVEPTIIAPTTPPTAEPTTVEPTTIEPTTPPTAEPTTVEPTTIEPTAPPTACSTGYSVYVRWGRTVCEGNATILYYGMAAGTQGGGSTTSMVCLPLSPESANFVDGASDIATMSGVQYGGIADDIFSHVNLLPETSFINHDMPCVLCEVSSGTVMTVPARQVCVGEGWNLEYNGYLMARRSSDSGGVGHVCVDNAPEVAYAGSADAVAMNLVNIEASCGALDCPNYTEGREITCAVCSK